MKKSEVLEVLKDDVIGYTMTLFMYRDRKSYFDMEVTIDQLTWTHTQKLKDNLILVKPNGNNIIILLTDIEN